MVEDGFEVKYGRFEVKRMTMIRQRSGDDDDDDDLVTV